MSLDKNKVDKFLDDALTSFNYSLSYAENSSSRSSFSESITAYLEINQVILDTSSGSIYRFLTELSGKPEKYDKELTEIWGKAKVIKIDTRNEVDKYFQQKSKSE